MIERLLAPDSISDLAIYRCILGKDTLRLFPIEAKQSTPFLVAYLDDTKNLQTEPPKIARCWLDRLRVPG